MANVPASGVYGFGRASRLGGFGLGLIVTPGTSTYRSDDGSFSIVRGSGAHYGNGLIDGKIIAGTTVDGYYQLDSNDTGLVMALADSGKYKVGGELQTFIDTTQTSPEYYDYLRAQRAAQEQANPKLLEFDNALRQWGADPASAGIPKDPVFGWPLGDIGEAPDYVQKAYADFTGNPIPEPPPSPPGPTRYLIAGISFGPDGTIYDSSGNPTGKTLTSAQVQSLLTTGALPAGSSSPTGPFQFGPQPSIPSVPVVPMSSPATSPTPTVPSLAPPTTNPTSQPAGPTMPAPAPRSATINVPTGNALDSGTGTQFSAGNPTLSIPPVAPPSMTPPGAPTATPAGSALSSLSSVPWWVWAGAGAVVLLSRKR